MAPRTSELRRLRDIDWRADRAADSVLYRRAAAMQARKASAVAAFLAAS